MLIFFTLDGQFLARAAKCSSGKMNLEVHFLKFALFLSQIVSPLDLHHLSYRYRPP